MPPLSAAQRSEIAPISSDPLLYPTYGGDRLRPKDDFVSVQGQRVHEIYDDLLNDPHCFAVWQKRVSSVVQREWIVEPGGNRTIDKKAADLVKDCLNNLSSDLEDPKLKEAVIRVSGGFDQVSAGFMKAIIAGRSFGEILWDYDGTHQYPKEVVIKPARRFEFGIAPTGGYKLLLLTKQEPDGKTVPTRKFICHFFGAEEDNPYGSGLGRKLYWAVYFKRQLAKFALAFADKYGSPAMKGTYPSGNTELRDILLEVMRNFAQETGVALPDSCTLEMLDIASAKGPDVYDKLIDFFCREMSKCVLGETGSTDQQGSGGSRARDQIGNEVRLEISKADSDLLSGTFNRTLVRWIVDYNYRGAAFPKVWRRFPELDQVTDTGALANRDNTITQFMGVKPKREYVLKTYNIELEEEKKEEDATKAALGQVFGGEGASAAATEPAPEETASPEEPMPEFSEPDAGEWLDFQLLAVPQTLDFFVESQHKRDNTGRFSSGGSGSSRTLSKLVEPIKQSHKLSAKDAFELQKKVAIKMKGAIAHYQSKDRILSGDEKKQVFEHYVKQHLDEKRAEAEKYNKAEREVRDEFTANYRPHPMTKTVASLPKGTVLAVTLPGKGDLGDLVLNVTRDRSGKTYTFSGHDGQTTSGTLAQAIQAGVTHEIERQSLKRSGLKEKPAPIASPQAHKAKSKKASKKADERASEAVKRTVRDEFTASYRPNPAMKVVADLPKGTVIQVTLPNKSDRPDLNFNIVRSKDGQSYRFEDRSGKVVKQGSHAEAIQAGVDWAIQQEIQKRTQG